MGKTPQLITAAIAVLLLAAALCAAIAVPPLRGRVNDYAGLMSPEQKRGLETRLAEFEAQTGHQVAVLTLATLDGEDIEGFSIRVAEQWQIGQKNFDNGVILVVAVKDRRLRLEVGYGLEGVLPDAIAKRIISEFILPRFRTQDYAGGISAGVDAVLSVIKKEPLPATTRQRAQSKGSALQVFLMFAAIVVVLGLMGFASLMNRQRRSVWASGGRHHPPIYWGGSGFGGGGFGGGLGGGFSGGGGSFGGGGASGSW